MSKPASSAPEIVVRHMGFEFEGLERHWLAGDPFLTQLVNGLHFVFPAGERFFIRSVKRYREGLSPELLERVQAFCEQEAEHQAEHRRAFKAIENQGYDVQSYLRWYRELAYKKLEPRIHPVLRLATTVALEHYTAVLGEFALTSDLLDDCDPQMRALLKWHACEEIEHKSVAFDVFEAVDGRYSVRLGGFVIGTATLFYFWGAGARHMLRQEPSGTGSAGGKKADKRVGAELRRVAFSLAPAILDFLRPGFHPDDQANYHFAEEYLEEVGRLHG